MYRFRGREGEHEDRTRDIDDDPIRQSKPGARTLTQSLATPSEHRPGDTWLDGHPLAGAVPRRATIAAYEKSDPASSRFGDLTRLRATLEKLASGGVPLPDTVASRYSSLLGADLSAVRIHASGAASDATAELGARALTHGAHIAFAPGAYDEATADRDHVLAHELVHVVQNQRSGGAAMQLAARLDVGPSGSAIETEAEAGAHALTSGRAFSVAARSSLPGISLFDGPGPAPTGTPETKAPPATTGAPPAATTGAPPAATTGAPPAATTGAPPAATTGAPPAATTGAPPAATTGAPPAATTGAPPAVTGAPPASTATPGPVAPAEKTAPAPAGAGAAIDSKVAAILEQRADPGAKSSYNATLGSIVTLRLTATQYSFVNSNVGHTLLQMVWPSDAIGDHVGQIGKLNAYRGNDPDGGVSFAGGLQRSIESLRGVLHILGDLAAALSAIAGVVAIGAAIVGGICALSVVGLAGPAEVAAGIAVIADAIATIAALVKIAADLIDMLLGLLQMVILVIRARAAKGDPAQRARFAQLLHKEAGDFAGNLVGVVIQIGVLVATAGAGAGGSKGFAKMTMKDVGHEFEKLLPKEALKSLKSDLPAGLKLIERGVADTKSGAKLNLKAGVRGVAGGADEEIAKISVLLRDAKGKAIKVKGGGKARKIIDFTLDKQRKGAITLLNTSKVSYVGIKNVGAIGAAAQTTQFIVDTKAPSGPGGPGGGAPIMRKPGTPVAGSLGTVQMWPSQIEAFKTEKNLLGNVKEHVEEQYENAKTQAGPELAAQFDAKLKAAIAKRDAAKEEAAAVKDDAADGKAQSDKGATTAGQGADTKKKADDNNAQIKAKQDTATGKADSLKTPPAKDGVINWLYNHSIGYLGKAIGWIQDGIKNNLGKFLFYLAGYSSSELDMAGIEGDMRTASQNDTHAGDAAAQASTAVDPVQQAVVDMQKDKTTSQQQAIQGMADAQNFIAALEEADKTLGEAIDTGEQYMTAAAPLLQHELETESAGKPIDGAYVQPLLSYADAVGGALDNVNEGTDIAASGNAMFAKLAVDLPGIDIGPAQTAIAKALADYNAGHTTQVTNAHAAAAKAKAAISAFVGTTDFDGCNQNAAALDKLADDMMAASDALGDAMVATINDIIKQYNAAIEAAFAAAAAQQTSPGGLQAPALNSTNPTSPTPTGGNHRLGGDFTPAPANGMGSPTPPPPPQQGAAGSLTINSVATAGASAGGAGADRSVVGIGEEVTFTGAGGESGTWTADGGTPTAASGNKFVWSAPGTAGNFTIKFTVGDKSATKAMSSILPTSVKFTKTNDWGPDADWMMGAGMDLDMELQPLTVSFTKATIREQPGGASNVSGYFAAGKGDISHHPTADPTLIRNNNKAGSYDEAHLADASGDLWPRPLSVGSMTWSIPYLFTAAGAVDQPFSIVTQTMSIVDSKGTVTVSKSDQSTSRSPKGHPPKDTFTKPAGDAGAGGSHARLGGDLSGTPATSKTDGAKSTEESLPDGINMQILSDGAIVARVAWLDSDPGKKAKGKGMLLPNRVAEMLQNLKASGVLGWMDASRIPEFADEIGIEKYAQVKKQKFTRLELGFNIYVAIGPPPGSDLVFNPNGKGLSGIIRQSTVIPGPVVKGKEVKVSEAVRTQVWTTLEQYTKMPIDPGIKAQLVAALDGWTAIVDPGQGGISFELSETLLGKIYGKREWANYLKQPKDEDKPSSTVISTGGVTFSTTIPEADRQYFLAWMKQISSGAPSSGNAPSQVITPAVIAELRNIDKHPLKDKILAQLKAGGGGDPALLDSQFLRNAVNAAETDQARTDNGIEAPKSADTYKPIFDEPVVGAIINRGGKNYLGQSTEFGWETQNKRESFAKARLSIQWTITKLGKPKEHLDDDTTSYLESSPKYFKYEWKETGKYTVHAIVTHSYYQPTHKSIDVEVETEAERTKELNAEANKGLEGSTTYETGDAEWPFDVSAFNTIFGSHKEEYGKKKWGSTPADFKRLSFDDRVKFLTNDEKQLVDLIAAHKDSKDQRWIDMVSYATDKLQTVRANQRTLAAESLTGSVFFEARGSFLSRKNGVPDKSLKLVANARKSGQEVKTIVHDFTQLYEPTDYEFSSKEKTFDKAIEATFVDLCKSYPPGRISCMFETLDDDLQPNQKTIAYEFDTGTAWKDTKSVIYNSKVQLVVNIAAAATMIFLPFTAPFLFPMLAVYNSVDVVDNMADLYRKGNLTRGSVAKGVAQIGLNFLPYVGEMKAVASVGKVALYTLEGVTIAGQAVLMTLDGVEQLRKLHDQDIQRVAQLDEQIRETERTNPSDPQLPGLKKQLDAEIKNAQDESTRVLEEMAQSGAIMLAQMAALKGLQTHMTNTAIEGLKSEGIFEHVEGGGEPKYDPNTGTIKGDQKHLDTGKLAKLKKSYALDMAAKQTEMQNVLGTDQVEITRGGDKVTITKEGDGYKVEIPKDGKFKDALDAAWEFRKASDPKAPTERPAPVIADVKSTLNVTEVVGGRNVAIGNRVEGEAQGKKILRKLAAGDRSAFTDLGMDAPPHDFDLRSVEWGLGQLPDGNFIIIRGEAGAVDWAGFKGVRPVSHSHPLTPGKMLDKPVTFHELVQGGGTNEVNKVNVFPSAADVQFTAKNGLGDHTVQTPYVNKGGGKIGNPTPGANEPLVSIRIEQPEQIGTWAGNDKLGVYKSRMVAQDANGKVLWTGDVYTVDHPAGSLVDFKEPPEGLLEKHGASAARDHGAGTSTPAGDHDTTTGDTPPPTDPTPKPTPTTDDIPPSDHVKIVQSADAHAERLLKQVKDATPEIEQQAKDAGRAAAENGYRERRKSADATNARKYASDQAKNAVTAKLATEAPKLAEARADQAISDGSVFKTTLSPEAKQQLDLFERGQKGGAAKRLAPELAGKPVPELERILDAEVASGNATRTNPEIDDPTDPAGVRKQTQPAYQFNDGSLVRIKPMGDEFNPGKPMFSVEVKLPPPGDALPKQQGVAFKVDAQGRPVPKGPGDIRNPYDGGDALAKSMKTAFQLRVLNDGHQKAAQ